MQVREQLFNPYWNQWLADTTALLQGLPEALNSGEQNSSVVLTFERWLLELKACPHSLLLSLKTFQSEAPCVRYVCMPAGSAPLDIVWIPERCKVPPECSCRGSGVIITHKMHS